VDDRATSDPAIPILRAAVVLGVGLGGFFDGIVFHQLLQWHHVLSSTVSPASVAGLELNTLADGVFHSATWVVTVAGVWLLVRARGAWADGRAMGTAPGRLVLGGGIAGWGGFNLVEGIIDHYVLGIHHVRPGPDEALYDLAFLAWGALFAVLGWWLARSRRGAAAAEAPAPAPVRPEPSRSRTRRT
jgi:uncharacterized membrane protein